MKKYCISIGISLTVLSLCSCVKEVPPEIRITEPIQESLPEDVDVIQYESDYTPHMGETLPVIRIASESKSNDFVTTPVSHAVKEAKKGWISNPNDPQLTAPDPYYEACTIQVTDENGNDALVDIPADVKVRGNWTTDYEKKPLRIKFQEKQSMLGLNNDAKCKNWVLLACYKDWSVRWNL